MNSNYTILVNDLVYEYPTKRALHGVNFTIESGSVTALVGPNGAGKTTILRCLAALEQPFSGSISICGMDTQDDPRGIHRKVAYLADFFGLYNSLTVFQCLLHMASIHEVPSNKQREVIDQVANELDLYKLLPLRAGSLSRGQKQRLAIAQSIIHKPPVLLLDEPAAGLDPEARHALSKLIVKFRDAGMTIIVSSHILSELEDYSTTMLTIQDGRVVGHEKISLSNSNNLRQIEVSTLNQIDELFNFLTSQPEISNIVRDDKKLLFTLQGDEALQSTLLRGMIENGFQILYFTEQTRSLQEVYLSQLKNKEQGNNLK